MTIRNTWTAAALVWLLVAASAVASTDTAADTGRLARTEVAP